jgi:hypothetical protein
MEKFIPYVPDPLEARYKFEKDKELDVTIESILGEAKDEQTICKLWHAYLSNNLYFHLMPWCNALLKHLKIIQFIVSRQVWSCKVWHRSKDAQHKT